MKIEDKQSFPKWWRIKFRRRGNYSEEIIEQMTNTLKELIAAYFKYCSNICLFGNLSTWA